MNIICQIDPSAFATGPRMHHGEDEVALEFPSSVSSRALNLLALKAQNWRAGGGPKSWTNPYITNCLVAMWDGEWNAGGGVHDGAATKWKELISGTDCAYSKPETPLWGDKCWRSVAANDAKYFDAFWPDGISGEHTIEIVALKNTEARGAIFGAYGLSSSNGCSAEWFVGQKLRMYYAGVPDLPGSAYSFPIGAIIYSCARYDGNVYQILNGSQAVIGSVSSSAKNLKQSPARIGTDSRTSAMCLNGDIYCIRVYSRALTTDEMRKNYTVDADRFGAA